jgi:hypothetical protein
MDNHIPAYYFYYILYFCMMLYVHLYICSYSIPKFSISFRAGHPFVDRFMTIRWANATLVSRISCRRSIELSFSEVRDAIFANPYQKVWGGEGDPALPRLNLLTVSLNFGTLFDRMTDLQ